MRKEQQPPLHTLILHHRRHFPALTGNKFTKPTAIVLLLLFSYALGYLSAPSSNSLHSPSPSPIPVIDRTVAAENTTAISADGDHYHFTTQCADPIPPNLVRHTILEKVFNGTSPYENFPPAHASGLLRPKRIKGWGSKGAVFENLIRRVQPKTIIEVGTFLGASAIHMAGLASRLGLETQILCVDDFRGWPGFHERFRDMKMVNGDVTLLYQFMQNVVHVNATGSVLFVPCSTGSALEKLCEWGVFGELVEIDAGHDFHSAWTDINRAYKLLRPGGVIFGHDYFAAADNKGVRRAVNLFAKVNGLRVQVDGQHWVIGRQ
ncbi:uncharacterized protein LOC127801655 [Diospyros lotus]|uniref:uncharacterized protein LOC127801655 n=1 Tax=Diospyros lotus TaxID=55363 RepID=UPI00224E7B67|nr:uncharacterized protein LOC127801655 [Diospyros lotus]